MASSRKRPKRNKRRKLPQQERSKATVEAILTATARVLVRDGYDRASTNRIAQEAGVSIGSLYQYFESKEALVGALLERHFAHRTQLLIEQAVALADAPLAAAVEGLIRAIIRAQSQNKRLERVILEQVPQVAGLDRLRELDEKIVQVLHAALQDRRHRNEVGRQDLWLAARVAYLAVRGATLGMLINPSPRHSENDLVLELTELVVSYLRASTPQRTAAAPS